MKKHSLAKIISDNVRLRRLFAKIPQKDLAKKVGVSQSSIAQIEYGRKCPSVRTLEKIAMGLNVEPWELLRKSEIKWME